MLIFADIRATGIAGKLKALDTRPGRFPIDPQQLSRYPLGMYLRITQRQNRDGSTVVYYALAENVWNAAAKRAEARVVHNFGRADQVDRTALQRLVNSINRVLDEGAAVTSSATPELPQIEADRGLRTRCRAGRSRAVGGSRHWSGDPPLHR